MTKQITTKLLPLLLTVVLLGCGLIRPFPARATNPQVLITEVQTGTIDEQGIEFSRQEFIELTNVSSGAVNMTGWKLEYLSAANNGSTPGLTLDNINGQISVNGRGLWNHDGYNPALPDSIFGVGDYSPTGLLAKSGGHIRLMNGTTMIDCVAWGSAVAISGCDKVNALAASGHTIQRQIVNGSYDKSAGVANLKPPTPQGGNIYALTTTPPVLPPPLPPVVLIPQKDCENIELSEILANPSGDDASGEFIELHNPTDQIQSLYGCIIKLSSGKQYEFPVGSNLLAKEYKAFMYATTSLQLTNSGATVTLATITKESATTYPAAVDDQSWALVEDTWQVTKLSTPNAANSLLDEIADSPVATLASELEACPAGKYRSLETNRCRNIVETAVTLTTCAADQERNPETGRCRKRTVAAVVTTCPAGQERSLVTNRCRKLEVASTAKACEAGQERNPETGRCRKVASTTSKVLGDTTTKKTYHFLLVGVILTGILGYGIYEYRHNLANLFIRLKKRLPSK